MITTTMIRYRTALRQIVASGEDFHRRAIDPGEHFWSVVAIARDALTREALWQQVQRAVQPE